MPSWMTHSWNQDCWEKYQQPQVSTTSDDSTLLAQVSTTSDDSTLLAQNEEGLNSLLMTVKEKSEKPGLKFSIPKTKIMASSHITSWQIEGEKVEAGTDFIFLGSKITGDGDYSHTIKRPCSLEGKL